MAREYHEFEGIAEGTADRPCTRCGLPDRHPVHALPDGYPSPVFRLAADLSRTAGQIALVEAYTRAVRRASEQGIKEGREALVAALLSELEAAKPDFRGIEVALRNEESWREPGLTGGEVRTATIAVKYFAEHLRQWLDAGAPERPALDRAWELINAQGGSGDSEYDRGRSDAFDGALEIIEQLGGMDPARRKAAKS